ncbi:MAG: AbrB/MazE/SpoVT family DNA-binding domain-containing protein [Methanotrichaceae archaeon]
MRAIVKLAKSGQVSIPPEIRDILGAEPGDYLEIDVIGITSKAKSVAKDNSQNPCEALAIMA